MKYFKRVAVVTAACVFLLGVKAAELGGKSSVASGVSELLGSSGLRQYFKGPEVEPLGTSKASPLRRSAGQDDGGPVSSAYGYGRPADNPGDFVFKTSFPDGGVVDGGDGGFAGLGGARTLTFISPPPPVYSDLAENGRVAALSQNGPTVDVPTLAVPEADTSLMLLVGAAVMAGFQRRRSRRKGT